jgi:hypothetical protein
VVPVVRQGRLLFGAKGNWKLETYLQGLCLLLGSLNEFRASTELCIRPGFNVEDLQLELVTYLGFDILERRGHVNLSASSVSTVHCGLGRRCGWEPLLGVRISPRSRPKQHLSRSSTKILTGHSLPGLLG